MEGVLFVPHPACWLPEPPVSWPLHVRKHPQPPLPTPHRLTQAAATHLPPSTRQQPTYHHPHNSLGALEQLLQVPLEAVLLGAQHAHLLLQPRHQRRGVGVAVHLAQATAVGNAGG